MNRVSAKPINQTLPRNGGVPPPNQHTLDHLSSKRVTISHLSDKKKVFN